MRHDVASELERHRDGKTGRVQMCPQRCLQGMGIADGWKTEFHGDANPLTL